MDFWIDSIKNSTSENIMIYLMGNKADLIKTESTKKVSKEQVAQFMNVNSNIIKYFECSAKTKSNLVEPFHNLCKGILF
jgi:GTPase SAR1 family protein